MALTVVASSPIGGEDAELLARIRERASDGYNADLENREADLDDRKFSAGEQWPDAVQKQRQSEGRPCLTLNRTGQFVRQVTGDIRMNKPAINVRPVEDADKQDADIIEGLIRHIEDSCRAQNTYVMAAEDQVRGGVGYFRVTREYCGDASFDQDIVVKPILNAHSVIMDPMCLDQTGRDAGWVIVYDEMLKAEFTKQFPDATPTGVSAPETGASGDTTFLWWQTAERIKVAEYWEMQKVPVTLVQFSDGSIGEKDAPIPAGLTVRGERKSYKTKIVMWLTNGTQILEGPVEFQAKRIPIIRVVGEEIRIGARKVRHGLIRFLKDSQRMENYWRSAMVEKAALAPKSPWLATAKMLVGQESAWINSATGNPNVLIYTPDPAAPGLRPDRVAPAPIEAAMMQQSAMAAEDMKAISGLYDASLGNQSNESSGKAILARERQGDTGTFVYADNLSHAISEAGRIMVDLIPVTYDARTQIRILGKDSAAQVIQVNGNGQPDLTKGKYDVTVSTGPSFSTKREEARQSMTEFIQAFPPAAPLIGDLIAKNSDWPYADEVAERLAVIAKASMPPDPNQPQPPDPAMVAAQAKAEGDAAKFQADMALKQIDVQTAQMNQQFEMQKMQFEMQKLQMQAQIQAQQYAAQMEMAEADRADKHAERAGAAEVAGVPAVQQQMGEMSAGLGQALQMLAQSNVALAQAMTAPKQIIRGQDGRAVGVASVQ